MKRSHSKKFYPRQIFWLSRPMCALAISAVVLLVPHQSHAQVMVPSKSVERTSTQENAGIPTKPLNDFALSESTNPNPNAYAAVDATHLKTSTGYRTDSVTATVGHKKPVANMKCLGLGAAANIINGQTDDLKFNYESASVTADCAEGYHKFLSSLGLLNRADTLDKSALTWTGRLGLEENREKWTLGFEIGHSVFADSLQTDYAVTNLLHGPSAQFNLLIRPAKTVRAVYTQKFFYFNDANRRTDGDVSVMYGLSPDWPWIWVGVGYERLTDSNSNLGHYWAPRIFEDIGPRIDLAVPLYGPLSYMMGLNFNWFRDIDFGTGFGYYGTAKIQCGQSDGRHAYVGIETIESKQAANKWSSLAWSAGVQWLF